jgi:hypothetical protein
MAKTTPAQRSEVARLAGFARRAKCPEMEGAACTGVSGLAEANAVQMREWSSLPCVRGDVSEYIRKARTPKIVKAYEELVDAAMKAGSLDVALRILTTMTAMVPATRGLLAPRFGKGQGTGCPCGYRATRRDTPGSCPVPRDDHAERFGCLE